MEPIPSSPASRATPIAWAAMTTQPFMSPTPGPLAVSPRRSNGPLRRRARGPDRVGVAEHQHLGAVAERERGRDPVAAALERQPRHREAKPGRAAPPSGR